jgi:hypothetical protein
LNMLNPISLAAFLLSAPASSTINSSVPTIAAVMSVSSERSTLSVWAMPSPVVAPDDAIPVPPVMVPT